MKRIYDKLSSYFLGCALLEKLEAHIKKLKVKAD